MESISSAGSISVNAAFQSNSTATVFEENPHTIAIRVEQAPETVQNNRLINQISQNTTIELTGIFQRIGIFAGQSLELGQTPENRDQIQEDLREELQGLRTLFQEISQDELSLFTAALQNQLPDALFNTGSSQNIASDSFFLDALTDPSLESLFRIDVTSDQGSLASLGLIESVLDILSARDSGTDILGELLNDLDSSIFNLQVLQISVQEAEGSTTSQDSDLTTDAFEPVLTTDQTNSNPPTIIELAG